MKETIIKIFAEGKGILAADESTHTIEKRFAAINLVSTPELNKKYRQMLFVTPQIEEFISGVILFDETARQKTDSGVSFIEFLTQKNIIPGIKVDGGLEHFGGSEEQVTKGLDGLKERLKEYSSLGLKFTKWRGVFTISDIFPSEAFLEENLNRMVQFAKMSQENGLVPIVEPEVLLDGNHTTTRCGEISTQVLKLLFKKLVEQKVNLPCLILKTNMVLPGKDSGVVAAPLEVANATLRVLKDSVLPETGGVVFLSGGQTPEAATANLNEIIRLKDTTWPISFSYSRALQEETMKAWGGRDENITIAQGIFYKRAKLVSKARQGRLE